VFAPSLPIDTERLLLRPFEPGDLDAVVAIHGDPAVVRYVPWDVRDRAELASALEEKAQRTRLTAEGDGLNLAAVTAEGGELVADMFLMWRSEAHRMGEIGYLLHPAHTGRGYATEAARALLRIGFEQAGLHRIIGRIDGRNTASARVLERLGMRREAEFVENELVKGEWASEVVYAMLDREWAAASRADASAGSASKRSA
jgi:RimJ/RimL family protein N-acetyltransferase